MKKIYSNPTTEFIIVATQQMMAGSVDAPINEDTQDNEEALGRELRRNNVWDEEEEEDY